MSTAGKKYVLHNICVFGIIFQVARGHQYLKANTKRFIWLTFSNIVVWPYCINKTLMQIRKSIGAGTHPEEFRGNSWHICLHWKILTFVQSSLWWSVSACIFLMRCTIWHHLYNLKNVYEWYQIAQSISYIKIAFTPSPHTQLNTPKIKMIPKLVYFISNHWNMINIYNLCLIIFHWVRII